MGVIITMQRGDDVRYFDWSTILDAPLSYGVDLDSFLDYYAHMALTDPYQYSEVERDIRIRRATDEGCSSGDREFLLSTNRCGEWQREHPYKGRFHGRPFDPKVDPMHMAPGVCWTDDEIWDYYVTLWDRGSHHADECDGADVDLAEQARPLIEALRALTPQEVVALAEMLDDGAMHGALVREALGAAERRYYVVGEGWVDSLRIVELAAEILRPNEER